MAHAIASQPTLTARLDVIVSVARETALLPRPRTPLGVHAIDPTLEGLDKAMRELNRL